MGLKSPFYDYSRVGGQTTPAVQSALLRRSTVTIGRLVTTRRTGIQIDCCTARYGKMAISTAERLSTGVGTGQADPAAAGQIV